MSGPTHHSMSSATEQTDAATMRDNRRALRRRRRRLHHLQILLVSAAILTIAMLLEVRPAERVGPAWFPSLVLPPVCMTKTWLGIPCPGCGLTRSFIFLAHGEVQASFEVHRLGWLLFLALLIQFPYRLWELTHLDSRPLVPKRLRVWMLCTVVGLLLANWLLSGIL